MNGLGVTNVALLLLRYQFFDDLMNTETRGTSAGWKLLEALEPLPSDRLRRDDQEDPMGEPIGTELTLRAALDRIGAQVAHVGRA